ncbi:methylated-DNA--[protein]-cysteine S-methyltransferase [Desulfosoma caldarium]|uniref:methylated-DNA--[protein]-cysteine S-methyltransferase n=1 Tax=Desulfosoma caldarium TaxID=610254 RepID=A0A3N1ULL2_9BACT|nr:methylated-DNA--[protein]-cysteine S-methyltransferase [Desulfosoma caldarium]ROQ89590.1 methylated-DNA-[protein]-cysteine S-methyltransferase [Desulfosoma caldarium]
MHSLWVDLFFFPSWGWFLTAATSKGLCACHVLTVDFQGEGMDVASTDVQRAAETHLHRLFPGTKLMWQPNGVSSVAREALTAYLAGGGEHPHVALDWIVGTSFQHRVWQELCRIPYGATLSYGDLARRLGLSQGARAVGQACGRNPMAIVVPCHRVIGRNGSLGGYSGGIHIKKALLALEGWKPDARPLP